MAPVTRRGKAPYSKRSMALAPERGAAPYHRGGVALDPGAGCGGVGTFDSSGGVCGTHKISMNKV